jgi:hypothetical protein
MQKPILDEEGLIRYRWPSSAAASIFETTELSTTPFLKGAQTSSFAMAETENTDKTSPINTLFKLFITKPVANGRMYYISKF